MSKEYTWAQWEKAENRIGLPKQKCSREDCDNQATYLAIAEEKSPFDPEEEIIKALCDEHFSKSQKKWLKKWRNKNIDLGI